MTPEEKIAELEAENARLKEEMTSAEQLLDEQSEKIESLTKATKGGKPEVEIDGDTYEVIHGLKHEGTEYSAASLAENPEVAKRLVAAGSSAIRKK